MSDKPVAEEKPEESVQQAQQAEENGSENAEAGNELEQRLAEAEAKAEENRNQYLRMAAELENVRKRAVRDVENAHKFGLERFLNELLPVKDSLEMGLDAAKDAKDQSGALIEGTEMTLKQLGQVLEKFGVIEMAPLGEVFNPEFHEAMAMQPSTEAVPNTVLTVVQKGYLLNGRVLRPARVLVARAPDEQ